MGEKPDNEAILRVEGVVKRFGGIVALDGVTMEIPRGSVTLLIGPNGSGKTTLVNVVSGFLPPEEGRVIFKGIDITGKSPHDISRLGLVRTFQIPKPFQRLTVLENVLSAVDGHPGENPFMAGILRGLWYGFEKRMAARAFEILGWVGLSHMWNRRANELSGGQMKLLEIARAIMKGAEMIIMDEPAAGVNPKLVGSIMERIRYLAREKGITFLIIEHRISLVKEYVDNVYAMSLGRVIASGSPDEVLNNPLVLESYLGG